MRDSSSTQMDSLRQSYPRSKSGRLALYYKGLALQELGRNDDALKALSEFVRNPTVSVMVTSFRTNAVYPVRTRPKSQLKPLKNQPRSKFQTRVNQSGFSSRAARSKALKAGLRVSETMPEIATDPEIVSANCR